MNTLSATSSLLAHSLVWALLYSLWQGFLLYATLYVLLKALPNVNARVKYYLSFSTLTALFAWFADTWMNQYQGLKGVTVYITQTGADSGAITTYPVKAVAAGASGNPLLGNITPHLDRYFPLFIIVYTAGLAFMVFRFLVNLWQVNGLRKQGLVSPGDYWEEQVLLLQKQFDIVQPVKLFLSRRISTPMMLGAIKPIILLPLAAVNNLTTEQLEAILLHELAHIKRHDYLLNIFQAIAETILFFNPFIWLISCIVRREREHCCDDLVVSCSANPLPYARALAILEEQRINNTGLALAVTGNKNQLFKRIKRIMEMKKSNINYSQLTIVIVAILAITFTLAMFTFTPTFAQKVKGDSDDTTLKSTYHTKTIIVDKNGKKTETEEESSKPHGNKKMVDIEEDDDNVNSNDAKGKKTKSYSYSYTYSDDDHPDLDKIMKDVTVSLNSVDWDAIKEDLNKGLAEINKELNDPKVREGLKEAKKALEKSRDAMEKAMKELESMPPIAPVPPIPPVPPVPPVPPAFPRDREVGKMKSNSYKPMLDKMEKDGLINNSLNYEIKSEDGKLYINGNKQPNDVYKKYEQYLKDKKVTIERKDGVRKVIMYED